MLKQNSLIIIQLSLAGEIQNYNYTHLYLCCMGAGFDCPSFPQVLTKLHYINTRKKLCLRGANAVIQNLKIIEVINFLLHIAALVSV